VRTSSTLAPNFRAQPPTWHVLHLSAQPSLRSGL